MPNTKKMSIDEILSKRQGHIRSTSRGEAIVKAVRSPRSWNPTERSARFVMTSESTDRYGDIVSQNGAQLDRFLENPVALLFHNSRGWPIGKWSDVEVKLSGRPKRMEGKLNFMGAGLDPDADRAAIHVENDTIRTVSIGFIPMEAEAIRGPEGEWMGINFTLWELVECSLVPIPANPDALIKGAGGDTRMLRDFVEDVLDNWAKTPEGLFLPIDEYQKLYKTTVEKIAVDKVTKTEPVVEPEVVVETKAADDEPVLWDDCHDMNVDQINRLCGRSVLFLTSMKKDDKEFGGTVIAASWDAAEETATKRGLGEVIIGQAASFAVSETDKLSKVKFVDKANTMHEVKISGVKWSADEIAKSFAGAGALVVEKTVTEPAAAPVKKDAVTVELNLDTAPALAGLREVNSVLDTVKSKFLEIFGLGAKADGNLEIVDPPAKVPEPTPEHIAAVKAKSAALRKRAQNALS